jgi:hypothetical protein
MLKFRVFLGNFFRKEMQAAGLVDLEGGTDKLSRNVCKQLPNNPEERCCYLEVSCFIFNAKSLILQHRLGFTYANA